MTKTPLTVVGWMPRERQEVRGCQSVPFLVRITISDLNIRKGSGTDYARTQFIPVGVYTIMEVKSGKGSTTAAIFLKSLDFCESPKYNNKACSEGKSFDGNDWLDKATG